MSENAKPEYCYRAKSAVEWEMGSNERSHKGLFRTEQYAGHRAFREERAAHMTLRSIIDRCNERPWVLA
jgi:hypothetical protein